MWTRVCVYASSIYDHGWVSNMTQSPKCLEGVAWTQSAVQTSRAGIPWAFQSIGILTQLMTPTELCLSSDLDQGTWERHTRYPWTAHSWSMSTAAKHWPKLWLELNFDSSLAHLALVLEESVVTCRNFLDQWECISYILVYVEAFLICCNIMQYRKNHLARFKQSSWVFLRLRLSVGTLLYSQVEHALRV